MTEPELIPNLNPWFNQWHDLAEVGMWGELRRALNEFATLYPDHPLIQTEASTDDLPGPGADSSQTTDFPIERNKTYHVTTTRFNASAAAADGISQRTGDSTSYS